MVIIGWRRTFTLLGVKVEECTTCGATCDHVVGRKVNWGTLFWMPILFLGFGHGMACTSCGAWTGIPFLKVRAAMRSGGLALDRVRPNAQAVLAGAAEEGQPPLNATAVYDRMTVNSRRGLWDAYLKAYPVIILGAIGASLVASALQPPPSVTVAVPAHTCWEDSIGEITGCRLLDGEIVGTTEGRTVTCYFVEPLREESRFRCEP